MKIGTLIFKELYSVAGRLCIPYKVPREVVLLANSKLEGSLTVGIRFQA